MMEFSSAIIIIILMQSISHKEFVHIRHLATNTYLTDTEISYKNGYVVGNQSAKIRHAVWIIEKFSPPLPFNGVKQLNYANTEVWPGDLVIIKSALTNNHLTSFGSNKSQMSKQGEVILQAHFEGTGEQQFIIQTDEPHFAKVLLVCVADQRSLHSHAISYKHPKECYEVTGFTERDNNDFWAIEPISEELRQKLQVKQTQGAIQPRAFKYVHHGDRIILRSYFTGGSLHSHNEQYKHGSKSQEITWRSSIRRDNNDFWEILISSGNHSIVDPIPDKALISLFHIATKQRLAHIKDARVKNKDFLEVCCAQASMNDFQIERKNYIQARTVIDKGIPELNYLIVEYPFRIKHLPTGQYLSALNRPSSKTTFQGEMCLAPYRNSASTWMIEIVDSIFD